MKKNIYEEPLLEVMRFKVEDIVRTSDETLPPISGGGDGGDTVNRSIGNGTWVE